MFEHAHLNEKSYRDVIDGFGGDEAALFTAFLRPVIQRFCRQNSRPVPSDQIIDEYGTILWNTCLKHDVVLPLRKGEKGTPSALDPDDVAELISEILDQMHYPEVRMDLALLSNQLVRAILLPEFKSCRLSYCEKNEAGLCERQNLKHSKKRVSGAHCVDCPLFVLTRPDKHPKVLRSQWADEGVTELETNMAVFLPEDYRQLRYFLHLQRRKHHAMWDGD